MPEPSAPSRVLLPFGVKIAVLVTGLVLLTVGAFGCLSIRISADLVEAEINERGRHTAQMIAEAMPRSLRTENGKTWSVIFEKAPPEVPEGDYQRQEERKAWKRTFEGMLGRPRQKDVLNIVVREGGVPTLVACDGEGDAFDASPRGGEGQVDGFYAMEGRRVAARRFLHPIRSVTGDRTFGELEFLVSLAAVDRARSRLFIWVGLLGIGALLAGLVFSLLAGGMLSRPLRTLAEDMRIVQSGHLGYRTAVKSRDEIGRLAEAFNSMSVGLQEAATLRVEADEMRYEFKLATEIQRNLLPRNLPEIPGFDIAACYDPALQVGGDYYDLIPLDNGRFAIVVGDVSGKGISAGLIMSMTRSLVQLEARGGVEPADLLRHINALLYSDLQRGTFVTLAYLVLDAARGEVVMASGGHHPLLHWSAARRNTQEVGAKGIALGVAKPDLFSSWVEEVRFHVLPGDRIVVYTDGVVEAKNERDEEYGIGRLRELAELNPDITSAEFIQLLRRDIEEYRGEAAPSDDITVVSFRRMKQEERRP